MIIKLWQLVTGGLVIFYVGMAFGVVTVAFFSQAKDN